MAVKRPYYVQIPSMLEFSRLVCALEQAPRILFAHSLRGKTVLSVHLGPFKKRPIIYHTGFDGGGNYLSYGFGSGAERFELADSTGNSGMVYTPIVRISKLPHSLEPSDTHARYAPMPLEDLSDLSRFTYGFSGHSVPLFCFPHSGRWMLGALTTFGENGAAYFSHVALDAKPDRPFLKFTDREVSFAPGPDGHGYSYVKIVRMDEPHPLVDHAQL